jgi:hypothetical protein
MLTVERTVSVVADGLRAIYGDEAQTVVVFVLRQCREQQDAQGEKVWSRVLERIIREQARPVSSG